MRRDYQNQLFANKANLFFPAPSGEKRVLLCFKICAPRANLMTTQNISDSEIPPAKARRTPSSDNNFLCGLCVFAGDIPNLWLRLLPRCVLCGEILSSTTLRLCGEFPNSEKFEGRNIVNSLYSLCVIRTHGINPSSRRYRAEQFQAFSGGTGASSDLFRGAPPPRVVQREPTGSR
jgi:hypothetical protein